MEYVLKTENLTKRYKHASAVDEVNLSVKRGEIYGFLGQNGAGKTTTLRMIMGLVRPSSGSIELFGESAAGKNRLFERIGSIIEFPGFYSNLTAAENLDLHRRLIGISDKGRVEEALHLVGIWDVRNRLVKRLSLGMKQRLGIARALLHHPELLILDEPTNGLDPVGIKEIRQLILDLAHKRSISILISSHILSEVQQLATKVGIIHKGKLLEEIELEALQRKYKNFIQIKVNNDVRALFLLEEMLQIRDYLLNEPGVIRIYERMSDIAAIARMLIQQDIEIYEITLIEEKLEDYFISLTGGAFHV